MPMRPDKLISLCVFTVCYAACAQSAAIVQMARSEVTAGDDVKALLIFDQPIPCPERIDLLLVHSTPNGGNSIYLSADAKTGQTQVEVIAKVPKDFDGEYRAENISIAPCAGYGVRKDVPVPKPPLVLNVVGVPDPNRYPSVISVALLPTQTQFLNTKSAELRDLSGRIDARVEENGMDSPALRSVLATFVQEAERYLQSTASQYQKVILKPSGKLPPFFADFQRQYDHLLTELRAPVPGIGGPVRAAYVEQLVPRSVPQTSGKGRNTSGTSPAIARAVKQSIDDNAAAYSIVSSSGKATFHAQFSSRPTGASLYYRQAILPDFQLWPSSTDLSGVELDLATFIFKFHKDDCADEPVRTVDPYTVTNVVVSVEFKRCKKR